MTKGITIVSDSGSSAVRSAASLNITFWDHIPQIEIWTEDFKGKRNKIGPSVLLKDESLKHFFDTVEELRIQALKYQVSKEQRNEVK